MSEYTINKNSISTRKKAEEIAKEAESCGHDVINLQNVEFISRSFADELVKQAELRDLKIISNESLDRMLTVVRA